MRDMIFKAFTGIAGIYHVILGISGLLLPYGLFSKVADLVLGVRPDEDMKFQLAVKFASAYVLAFGATLLLLCKDPVKHRMLVIPVLLLFGTRILSKLVLFGSVGSTFEIPFARSLFAVCSLLVFFFGILLTIPKTENN